ncbi:DUF4145 domain-containing protein [Pseudomonas corrugata]|uniref:DUF4145 domain-containing protein n=1 Tax=Pseudomonas corrugata TaxID=47879 RepID=UPI001EE68AA6|nr:DUF4145 domain-containing protein [Pseudomonas corrugata]
MKYISPSVQETAFNCPHCGALAKQFWSNVFIESYSEDKPRPRLVDKDLLDELDLSDIKDVAEREKFLNWFVRMAEGAPFIDVKDDSAYLRRQIRNCNISDCFNCHNISIWIYDKLIYPVVGNVVPANPDMSDDIRRDYEEAGAILNQSPRGAAALLRLAIQKLCKELGQPGENINEDIKSLVAAGLDARVQQSLDAVRVIGNSAVHPGKIDIRDDRATAEALFKLLNLIVDKTISEPKHIKEIYESLPESLREAIAKRDTPKS